MTTLDANLRREAEEALGQERKRNRELDALARELREALSTLVEASWDGRVEVNGLETYTDPARAALQRADAILGKG